MERNNTPMQTNPTFGFVQNSGVQYRPDTGQNLSTPTQTLPPPPPLVRLGQPSSTVSLSGPAPISSGNSKGQSVTPGQLNSRPSFPGVPQPGPQQYGNEWVGQSSNTFMSMPGSMPIGLGDPLIRQALRQQVQQGYDIVHQDKHGQNNNSGIAGARFTYGGFPNRLSAPHRERMSSNFNGGMPSGVQQNMPSNFRQAVPNNQQNFSLPNFGQSMNQGLRQPQPIYQNVQRVPHPAHQHFQSNLLGQGQQVNFPGQGHTTVKTRPAHVSSPFGVGPLHQSPFNSQPVPGHTSPGQSSFGPQTQGLVSSRYSPFSPFQGHISPGQCQVQISSGQGNTPNGQGSKGLGAVSQQGYSFSQGQAHFQGHVHPQPGSLSGPGSMFGRQQNEMRFSPEGFLNISDVATSLAQLSDGVPNTQAPQEPGYRLLQLKERLGLLEKQGLLGPGETADAVLARFFANLKEKQYGGRQPASQTCTAHTYSTSTTIPSVPKVRQNDASAIQTAFAIPASHETDDKAVLSRWYAPPSSATDKPAQTQEPARNFVNITNIGPCLTTETTTTNTCVTASTCVEVEPFVLKPTVCNEQVIEYKVADLLRCFPQKARSQHTDSFNSVKSTEQATNEANQNQENSVLDQSEQNSRSSAPENIAEEPVEELERVQSEISSREISPDLDEQSMETDSLLGFSKKQLLDRLVLDSQFGSQDMNPEIDFRNYLPSPGFPAGFSMTPSPETVVENQPSSETAYETDSKSFQVCTENEKFTENSTENSSKELCASGQNENNAVQDSSHDLFRNDNETEHLPEPVVEIDIDETPELISKKRKHSNSNLEKFRAQAKRQRGSWRGRPGHTRQGGATRSRGRGRGRPLLGSLTPKQKQTKTTRGKRKQTAKCSRGGKRKPNPGTAADTRPVTNKESSTDNIGSPSRVGGLDGQVIQKPQDLKNLMDNLPHEELEKATVSLSTLKMMLAWQEAKTTAGPDDIDEESDAESVNSVNDEQKTADAENADTADVTSEMNNKEHNVYEPPEGSDPIQENSSNDCNDKETEGRHKGVTKDVTDQLGDTATAEVCNENKKHEKESTRDQDQDYIGVVSDKSKVKSIADSKDKTTEVSKTSDYVSENTEKNNDTSDTANVTFESAEKLNTSDAVEEDDENNASTVDGQLAAQAYAVTSTHKMTWVRYHGRTVTHLITPEGKFFIMKEILKRCFRIQEPNKNLKFSKIGILKREVLKIPDIELEPLFYNYVVKNLVDRKIIRNVPEQFIIISEEDANRLFHYVCKDKYCGNACVTPFFKAQTGKALKPEKTSLQTKESSDKQTTVSGSNENDSGSTANKVVKKKDRNSFDFIENETLPKDKKTAKVSKGRKRQKHLSVDGIDLNSEEENMSGNESDKTLPYVDGKAVSFQDLKELNGSPKTESCSDKRNEKGNMEDTEMTSCQTNNLLEQEPNTEMTSCQTNSVLEQEPNTEVRPVDDNKIKSAGMQAESAKSNDSGSGMDVVLEKGNTGESEDKCIDSDPVTEGAVKEISTNESALKDTRSVIESNTLSQGMNNSYNTNNSKSNNVLESDVTYIIIGDSDDDDSENAASKTVEDQTKEGGICQLTLDQMKKEISVDNLNESRRESLELVQVNNIDSTAISVNGASNDNQNTDKILSKHRVGDIDGIMDDRGETDKINGAMDSITSLMGMSEKYLTDIDSVPPSDKTSEDVTIGEWIFPAPPKNYPEDGTTKLEEAGEALDKFIEKANNAKNTDDYVDILDSVFRMTEPLNKWTNTVLDNYEGLLIEAQRLKSLDQLKLKDISNTGDFEDD